jgi:hypothetical protein
MYNILSELKHFALFQCTAYYIGDITLLKSSPSRNAIEMRRKFVNERYLQLVDRLIKLRLRLRLRARPRALLLFVRGALLVERTLEILGASRQLRAVLSFSVGSHTLHRATIHAVVQLVGLQEKTVE